MTKVFCTVCNLVKIESVVLTVLSQSAFEVIAIPLQICVYRKFVCALSDEVFFASNVYHRVRVNVLLELGLQQIC